MKEVAPVVVEEPDKFVIASVYVYYLRLFKNVVAQFIGHPCLMNQATTKIWR